MKQLIFLLSIFLIPDIAFAEAVHLTSGQVIEGKIVERTDELIKVDVGGGIVVSYYFDEIESIAESEAAPEPQKEKETAELKKHEKVLPNNQGIKFYAVSLFEGMRGSFNGVDQKTFKAIQSTAKKVNLDLGKLLDEQCVYRQLNDKLFLVFYNLVEASGCPREYLIQRVVLDKQRKGGSGGYRSKKEYLVEVFKLNNKGFIKGADEHFKLYSLGSSTERYTRVTLEVGCGEIPGVAEGKQWPFPRGILYKNVQDYSKMPSLYNKINFDFSKTYSFSVKFGKNMRPKVKVPGFVCREH